jgi:hypothetical protein
MMMRITRAKLALMVWALLTASACARLPLKKKEPIKPFVPPPIVVRTIPTEPLVVGEPPANPGLYLDPASIPFPIFAPQLELPERPKPQPVRTRPTAPPAPAPETVEPPVAPPVAVPKLTQIMSDEEARKYRADVDEARGSAEKVLDAAAKRPLTAEQGETVRQVRDLLRQAQAQQDTDLVSARTLARRAAVLARDLQTTLR